MKLNIAAGLFLLVFNALHFFFYGLQFHFYVVIFEWFSSDWFPPPLFFSGGKILLFDQHCRSINSSTEAQYKMWSL